MQLGAHVFDLHRRIAVMGIVNRTPDSFYDRGATYALDAAVATAERQVDEGADIIDVGGVKAGPGPAVDEATEIERVLPFVEALRARSDIPLSVDTYRPAVAHRALEAGADIVNDVTGLSQPSIAGVVAAHPRTALVLTHHGGAPRMRPFRPNYDPDVVTAVRRRLALLIDMAVARGVAPEQLIVDPGHDMCKTTAHSLAVTRHVDDLATLGPPVLLAMSNKDFIGETLGVPLEQRGPGSLAAAVFGVLRGARIVRVHDVAGTVHAVRMVEALLGWRAAVRQVRGLE